MKSDGQVSVPCWGSSFLYKKTKQTIGGGKHKFPSPIGEVVSYIVIADHVSFTGEKFPSPIGEVVSYIERASHRREPCRALVSVPYRGSSFLYAYIKYSNGCCNRFPSPIGEVVSYIHGGKEVTYEHHNKFPSPIVEVVSYILKRKSPKGVKSKSFPSPIGEVVSYIVARSHHLFRTTHGFPSPIGEVVSYMTSSVTGCSTWIRVCFRPLSGK